MESKERLDITLERQYFSKGTNGNFLVNGSYLCQAIELPWKENQRGISCIPEGVYELTKRYSGKFGKHLLVNDVPGRDLILIHCFNEALKESRGCIAPVMLGNGPGKGQQSKAALRKIIKVAYEAIDEGKEVYLTIRKSERKILIVPFINTKNFVK